jgi:hypothetical protein
MSSHPNRTTAILLALSLMCACSRPPADGSPSATAQKLPFDREPRSNGISPSQTLVPSTTKLPEGTTIQIRLDGELSSGSAHAEDTFKATIDQPVEIDGEVLLAKGVSATGRVLEAKAATSSTEPGYLRIVLVSLNLDGKEITIYTASIFVKGNGSPSDTSPRDKEDVVLGVDRRLNFRLAQTIDLQ